ncbi:hypothetical protein DFH09DRAFT_1069394 [Mycena vulgaris]|nr:hypothetical protein DFH09DRAFT_1069394 [Mycena vulgaris]
MAFLNIFGADFFNIQDKDTPNVPTTSSSSSSSFTPVASSSRNNSYTLPSPAVPTRPTSHQSLPALHIPLHMTPSYHHTSSSSLRTPDSGYYSAVSNSSGSHSFSAMSPLSPLDTRSGYAFQPALPAIIATAVQTNIDEYMDDEDDEAHDNHPHIHGPLRLLQLYRAGKITAEVAENNCWRIECNVCGYWCPTSLPARIALSIPGHFTNLESHQSGNRCRSVHRGKSAPPDPQRSPKKSADPQPFDDDSDDEDPFNVQFNRSSSVPAEPTPSTLPSQTHETQTFIYHPCPGVRINWPMGSSGTTFPWHRVFPGPLQTESFRVESNSSGLNAFSTACTGSATLNQSCSLCAKLPARIEELHELASNHKSHTNYRFLNFAQTSNLLTEKDILLRKWRTKCSSLSKQLGTCIRKINDYRRFSIAVAESNAPQVRRLIAVGLRNGATPRSLTNLLQDVFEGVLKYTPRASTEQRSLDLSLLSYNLGGRKLLYAMCHGMGLPSLRTLRRHLAFTRIMPTIGWISAPDIEHNIKEVVLKPRQAAEQKVEGLRGVTIMIDEVALEERAVHFRHNNSIGGICWRHSSAVDLVLKTFEGAVTLSKAIKNGTVHLGKEMTVCAVGIFGENGTYPILAVPSCKHVNAEDSGTIYEIVTSTWNRVAAGIVGPIWSWATDGDMRRRIAGFCTSLRSPGGIALNNGRIITTTMLARYLVLLPGQTPESVQGMLFPHDPQDVPTAVLLMKAVFGVGSLNFPNMTPNLRADLDAIELLGHVLKAILEPFIRPEMDLTDQMTSLSTYAHLSFAFYRDARDQFISNQLYGDSQSMVKNAMFCLAKQQALDPTKPFYLFQLGDDRLERLFGKLRMIGGHNSAMNFMQAIDRLGHAVDLQGALMRNPDLDQGERRLNMTRAEGVDHLTMKAWTGNAISGQCHLPSAWSKGCEAARAILHKYGVDWPDDEFERIFAMYGFDMLRPFGNDKYPGVDTSVDRSMPGTAAVAVAASSGDIDMADAVQDSEEEETGDGITLEESLADTAPELELPSGPGIVPTDYIAVEGKWVHKQRICKLVVTGDFEPKSTVRLLRVRGYNNVNAKPRDDTYIDPASILGKDVFVVGDPVLTLLKTDTTISVAVLRTTAIHQDGISRSSLLATTIANPAANVKVTGQVYAMTLARKTGLPDSDLDSRPTTAAVRGESWPDPEDTSESEWAWIWNGEYLRVDSSVRGTLESTEKVVVVSVPGCMTELVDPLMVDATIHLGAVVAKRVNTTGQTWEIADKQLGIICELLWERALAHKIAPSAITSCKSSAIFPYRFDDGTPALVSRMPSDQLAEDQIERANRTCERCDSKVDNQRAHMGAHILRKLRGVEEAVKTPVTGDFPCGFCGETGRSECAVFVKVASKSTSVETNCRLKGPIKYAYAERGSATTPCRNVPLVCILCHELIAREIGRLSHNRVGEVKSCSEESGTKAVEKKRRLLKTSRPGIAANYRPDDGPTREAFEPLSTLDKKAIWGARIPWRRQPRQTTENLTH